MTKNAIPEGWSTATLGDLFDLFAGGDWDRENFTKVKTATSRFAVVANALQPGAVQGWSPYATIPGASLTITGRGDVGKAVYRPDPFVPIVRLLALVPREGVSARFYTDFINSQVGFPLESTGVPQLTVPQVRRVEVLRPPPNEQAAIADALRDTDSLIESLALLVAKKRAIKQGLVQELLTGRTRLPGHNDEWRLQKWSQVTTRRPGNGMIKGRLSAHRTRTARFQGFSASGPDVWLTTYDFEGEGVVVSAVGSRSGKSFLATGKWSAIANTHVVLPVKGQLDARFAHLYLNDEEFWIKGGSGQPFVQMKASLHRDVLLPPLPEQRAIGEVLADADADIEALERRLEATLAIKQGMMQELFNGRTRLVGEGAA